ncbi:uncharacterized protein LOC124643148 [Helicoverpa zea]|uniref:uncharacterized protein LOC124643148 n=1 Tax=Helicoverpa zea TaxID=7113 RepID=UPI001F5ABB77|nr:uncharacterized protein LOC124643148 [Helicoverpa zea]
MDGNAGCPPGAGTLHKSLAEVLFKLAEALGKCIAENLDKSVAEALGKSLAEALGKSLAEGNNDTASNTANAENSTSNTYEEDECGPVDNSADSRWTLKHKKRAPGLKELIPESGVYINARSFENIETSAKNASDLIRKLMPEIFSEKALNVCSLKGKFNRPGLDCNAVRTILTFVDEYGAEKKWDKYGRDVCSVMRSWLNNYREKNAQKKNTDSPRGKQ